MKDKVFDQFFIHEDLLDYPMISQELYCKERIRRIGLLFLSGINQHAFQLLEDGRRGTGI
jgi:hypothetical protein